MARTDGGRRVHLCARDARTPILRTGRHRDTRIRVLGGGQRRTTASAPRTVGTNPSGLHRVFR
jgi:hypothetical protein